MDGDELLLIAGGVAVGFLLAMQLKDNESSCCKRVSAAAREMAGEVPILGGVLRTVGDAINIWPSVPPLLDLFGVDP